MPQPSVKSFSPAPAERWLYLWLGPDRFRKRERLAVLTAAAGVQLLDRHDRLGGELSAPALPGLVRERPAMSPVRLLVIDEAHRLAPACLDWLTEHSAAIGHAIVVLMSDQELSAKHPLHGLERLAVVEQFAVPSPIEARDWMVAWLSQAGKRAMPGSLQRLLAVYGPDLPALAAALEQLVAFVGERTEVTEHDAEALTAGPRAARATAESSKGSFALVEMVARRNAGGALRVIDEQLDTGKDVLELLGMLVWQLQRWVMVAGLMDAGVARDKIAMATGMQAWQLGRIQGEIGGWSIAALRRGLETCWRLDTGIKTGKVVPRLGLEQVVVQLCAAGRAR